jgi:hypothetical protein
MTTRTLEQRLQAHITPDPETGHHIWSGPFDVPKPKIIKPTRYINRRTSRVSVTKGIRRPRPILTYLLQKNVSVIRLILGIQNDPTKMAFRLPTCKLHNCVNPNHFRVHIVKPTPTPTDEVADLIQLLNMVYPRQYLSLATMREELAPEFTIEEYTRALSYGDFPEWQHLLKLTLEPIS